MEENLENVIKSLNVFVEKVTGFTYNSLGQRGCIQVLAHTALYLFISHESKRYYGGANNNNKQDLSL